MAGLREQVQAEALHPVVAQLQVVSLHQGRRELADVDVRHRLAQVQGAGHLDVPGLRPADAKGREGGQGQGMAGDDDKVPRRVAHGAEEGVVLAAEVEAAGTEAQAKAGVTQVGRPQEDGLAVGGAFQQDTVRQYPPHRPLDAVPVLALAGDLAALFVGLLEALLDLPVLELILLPPVADGAEQLVAGALLVQGDQPLNLLRHLRQGVRVPVRRHPVHAGGVEGAEDDGVGRGAGNLHLLLMVAGVVRADEQGAGPGSEAEAAPVADQELAHLLHTQEQRPVTDRAGDNASAIVGVQEQPQHEYHPPGRNALTFPIFWFPGRESCPGGGASESAMRAQGNTPPGGGVPI